MTQGYIEVKKKGPYQNQTNNNNGIKKFLTMLLQLPQSLERNVAIETINQSTNASYAEDRHVPMQLSIQTLENQEVWYVHPGTSIQQPITAKPQNDINL